MEIIYATKAAPGTDNEDYVLAGTDWIIVFDGATHRPGVNSGCIHTVSWLVQHLAGWLSFALTSNPDISLSAALESAILNTRKAHEDTCDLENADSPSSTALIVRMRAEQLEYLVLGDSPLLLNTPTGIQVITDERSAGLPSYTPESVRSHRNQPHGFWIASTRPEAAYQAITDSFPMKEVSELALLSDGASRYVERLGLGTWEDLFNVLKTQGPTALISQVRQGEKNQLPPLSHEPNGRMVKQHDDATAVLIHLQE